MPASDAFIHSITPSATNLFPGCDGGDPGTPQEPAIWLFGLEPGNSLTDQAKSPQSDSEYSVETQLKWPFNRNAFKLLAEIEGNSLKDYRGYAHQHKIFEKGAHGYFKGNLYPVAVRSINEWSQALVEKTGFQTKDEYQEWCRKNHFKHIREWVSRHKPKLIIGCGTSFLSDFACAFLGDYSQPEKIQILGQGRVKNLYFFRGTPLVVVPHLSGGAGGLVGHESIIRAAEIILNAHPAIRSDALMFENLNEEHASAVRTFLECGHVSISILQRCWNTGYSAALKVMTELQELGVVTDYNDSGSRFFTQSFLSLNESALQKLTGR